MLYEYKDLKYAGKTITGVLIGVLVGGLAGAVTMLLLAPRSGKDTRAQLQKKGSELRNRTGEAFEDTVTQVRAGASRVTTGLRTYRQKLVAQQLSDASEAMQAGIETVD